MALNKNTLKDFKKDVAQGGVTLVLGAGVSVTRGIPAWGPLVGSLWKRAFPSKDLPQWIGADSVAPHPLALQILVEEIELGLRSRAKARLSKAKKARTESSSSTSQRSQDVIAMGERELVNWIREELYRDLKAAAGRDTLSVLGEILKADQMRGERCVQRVITFNADDLLELEINEDGAGASRPTAWSISRASQKPRRSNGANGLPPIPIYHPHGFLPQQGTIRDAPDVLVFTDAQYWDSVSRSGSFANRVVTNALYDSKCIFIGLSMTDVNLMRWLGLRHGEVIEDKRADQRLRRKGGLPASRAIQRALDRHYWIRARGGDAESFISGHLRRRGVRTLEIDGWGAPFDELMQSSFGQLS